MALAPLSQTLLLTEDGSVATVTAMVTIPPYVPLSPPPVITTPADITSDGTPQVGEQLTGVDPVATFATFGNRRWMRGDTVVARTRIYTPTEVGEADWVVDVIGIDETTVLTSVKRVTIAAISAPNPTIDNTLADSTLPISAIPGLLERVNALDARLTALGLAAVDPDVADAIAAVLVDLAEAIDAIDLHRTLAVVLPALEAAMMQLEEAAQNPNPQPGAIDWGQSGIDWGQTGIDWGASTGGGNGGASRPALTLSGPATVGEGNPAASGPALTLSGPLTVIEGNPSASAPALTLSGPATVTEGNPSASNPALTLSGPTTVTEGNPSGPALTLSGPATLTEGN